MKKNRIIFFLFFTISLFGQNTKDISDAEFLKLQEKTRSFFNTNIDSCLYYINKIESSRNKIHLAFAKGAKGNIFSKNGKTDEAIDLYNQALNLINGVPNSELKFQNLVLIYIYGGNIYKNQKSFSKALDYYFIAKGIAHDLQDEMQVSMINLNIGNIYNEIGNYEKAIKIYKIVDSVVDLKKLDISQEDYYSKKSFVNFNLGISYEGYFAKNRNKLNLLDSAFHFYDKTIKLYSNDNLYFKMNSLKNIGNIYFYKNELNIAEENYLNAYSISKQNKNIQIEYSSAYNLGLVYFEQKKVNKALHYFQSVDSLYNIQNNLGVAEYIDANFKQAKIYNSLGDYKRSLLHSAIYLNNSDKINQINNNNIIEVNKKLNNIEIRSEIQKIIKDNNQKIFLSKVFIIAFIFIFALLIFLIFNKFYTKKKFKERIEKLIEEYEIGNAITDSKKNEKSEVAISLHVENENEILERFRQLIEKKEFLKTDFTQQFVAKKIKTNTTYLSSIVNKHYQKSFSTYLNELRINYVINEIMMNSRYREYTTQAIAESAGFKNADSFTTSFKKKTGITPFQFINEIKKRRETS
ncbi:conserved hypothetical protein [Flavobacterium sp. 9AF]|uniref:helix-turn-helix domain-containing protein n=1 Tax=Flavobacterium sp. 9AF TaxID=2653142 RepID=UPI0012F46661|nr:helix-turn-helix domain-containing protein [Flavobacterium sp. 9AF]VXC02009.1 conserved hypothetical protein [Flavobacterium sp. 9AF]